MTRTPPTIANFADPFAIPVPVLLDAAADGLRALGQREAAGYLHGIRIAGLIDNGHRDRVAEIGRLLSDISDAYNAAGNVDWANVAQQIVTLLDGAMYRRRVA